MQIDIPAFDWPAVEFPKLQYPLEENKAANDAEEKRVLEEVKQTIKDWRDKAPVAAVIVEVRLPLPGSSDSTANSERGRRPPCLAGVLPGPARRHQGARRLHDRRRGPDWRRGNRQVLGVRLLESVVSARLPNVLEEDASQLKC